MRLDAAAAILDCDGVLADTEEHSWEAWRACLRPWGIEVTVDEVEDLTGRTFAAIHRHFAGRATLPDAATFETELTADVLRRFADLRPYPDVPPFLDELAARGLPLAVASSSSRVRLDATLAAIGLSERFVRTVAGDEVAAGKPAPDLYLAAARQLGVAPERCLVVEDMNLGVLAGNAAGATVVAVRRSHNGHLTFATPYVVDRLSLADLGRTGLRLAGD